MDYSFEKAQLLKKEKEEIIEDKKKDVVNDESKTIAMEQLNEMERQMKKFDNLYRIPEDSEHSECVKAITAQVHVKILELIRKQNPTEADIKFMHSLLDLLDRYRSIFGSLALFNQVKFKTVQ